MPRTRRTPTAGPLTADQWTACGIVMLTCSDGTRRPSHVSRGDDHADAIITGRYPVEQARKDFAAAQAMLDRWRRRGEPTFADHVLKLTR